MARLSNEYIDRVNAATDIVSVIGEQIKLKKMGAQYVGLCPFHNEKTPSFSVNPDKNVYHCRGCGQSGNAIQFLMQTAGGSFQETVAELAKRVGLEPPSPMSQSQERENGQIVRLHETMEKAKNVYKEQLKGNAQAMAYLRDRGVTDEMIETFEIGYAPRGGQILREKLKDVSEKDMIAAGLLYKSQYNDGTMAEWMNHRIIFPIFNSSGKTLAFGGRSMIPGPKRKYLNTPETLLFKKGSELYGLYQASNAIRQNKHVIVTEGYMDSVVPSGMGVKNVVSAMGTAFGTDNLRKLFRLTDRVVFCFDGDTAGRAAALRSMDASAEFVDDKKTVRFAFLPEGMDPDEFVLQNGAQAFQTFIDNAQPMSKFMLSEYAKSNDMTCAEGRASFACQAMRFIERIQSPMLKIFMVQDVKAIIGPDIPLPGVTEGIPALVPEPIRVPPRSAIRVFRESKKAAPIAQGALQPDTNQQAVQAVEIAQAAMAAKTLERDSASEEDQSHGAGDSSGPKRLNFRKPSTMLAASRESENNQVPSQAVRLLAFLLREPRLAMDDEGPLNIQHLSGSPEEIKAVLATIDLSITNDGQELPSTKDLIGALSKSENAAVVVRTTRLPEFLAEDMDVLGEVVGILKRMTEHALRSERSQRMRIIRPK